MRFYGVYTTIANRPGYWSRRGELFADYDEAVAAMNAAGLRGAMIAGADEMWEFSKAVLPEEEVMKRRVEVTTPR